MNIYIFDFLINYYKNESKCLNINKNRFAVDNIEKLYNSKKITEEERNELLTNLDKTLEYTIKILSECPYMNIRLNNNVNHINSYKDNNGGYFLS